MRGSWFRAFSGRKSGHALDGLSSTNATLQYFMRNPISTFLGNGERKFLNATTEMKLKRGICFSTFVCKIISEWLEISLQELNLWQMFLFLCLFAYFLAIF